MKKRWIKGAASIAALLFWILVWHLVASEVKMSLILPKPGEVLLRLWELGQTKEFYETLFSSLLRISEGYLAGIAAGIAMGYLAYRFSFFDVLIRPLMSTVRATPVASFILMVWLWMERDGVPAFISFLMVLPIVWQNTILGFQKRDPRLGEMARVFCFGKWKTFLRVDLPQVLPFLFSSAKTGLGLAWKAGVAAEVLALPRVAIGRMIYNAKMYLETVDLYAWTLAIILLSMALERFVGLILKARGGHGHAEH